MFLYVYVLFFPPKRTSGIGYFEKKIASKRREGQAGPKRATIAIFAVFALKRREGHTCLSAFLVLLSGPFHISRKEWMKNTRREMDVFDGPACSSELSAAIQSHHFYI